MHACGRSRQIAKSSLDWPFRTSCRPKALGAILPRQRGIRRSQSTNNVRAPVIAINRAIDTAVVDLPSSGIERRNSDNPASCNRGAEIDCNLNGADRFRISGQRRVNHSRVYSLRPRNRWVLPGFDWPDGLGALNCPRRLRILAHLRIVGHPRALGRLGAPYRVATGVGQTPRNEIRHTLACQVYEPPLCLRTADRRKQSDHFGLQRAFNLRSCAKHPVGKVSPRRASETKTQAD